MGNTLKEAFPMPLIDPLVLTALASLITALSGLVWSLRRKP